MPVRAFDCPLRVLIASTNVAIPKGQSFGKPFSLELLRTPWIYRDSQGFLRYYEESYGVLSGFRDLQVSSGILRGSQGFSEVLKRCQRSSRVLRGPQGFSEVLKGYWWIPRGSERP